MADGSIIIDTRIDIGGVLKGINAVRIRLRNTGRKIADLCR